MPKVTQHQIETQQALIGDIYAHLEQAIFDAFVKRLKARGISDYDQTSILGWQMQTMNDLHLINDDVVQEVANATGLAKDAITDLFQKGGYSIESQEYGKLAKATRKKVKPNLTKQILDGYQRQTFLDLDNNINQTLLTTNKTVNPAVQVFQQIAKETTSEVITGLKTPERALADTIYKWRAKGISRGLIDKGGHAWSLESYARTVITATSNRAFQAVRDQAAADYGIDTFLMSSHAASREACAPIQGHTVTTRLQGFIAPESGEWFEPLDPHGYGEPGGTFGINCHHIKWPYVPGVNSNNQQQFDPREASQRGLVQQKQRALERRVRGYKNNLDLATKLKDAAGIEKYKLLVRSNQAALRQLVKNNDFLARDYSREKSFGYTDKEVKAIEKRVVINPEKQNRHIRGTDEFKQEQAKRKAQQRQSQGWLDIDSDSVQKLIYEYGVKDMTSRRTIFTHTEPIGEFVDQKTGEILQTSRGMIKYSKTGAHIYPADPRRSD
jgi:predicted DNA-binding protein YlxM (UPF0122 family)